MSMIVQISVQVKNLVILRRALCRMSCSIRNGRIFNAAGKALCTIKEEGDHYALVARSESYMKEEVRRRLNKIKQSYALEEVIETARQNGWTALSHEENNGTVRIRLAV